ncbi:unnamed protein product [Clonostachys rosea]|uniref:Amino acid permease/ SLC12A domain-containing protein n=1 Tax=Bionectria ochroleuca TaxID=29856 RepID=A0ABY6UWD7_BIOOC|nr:unnamed protein product [Clonostachys rosea]
MPSDKKDDESLRRTGSNKIGDVSTGVVIDEVSHAGGLHRVLALAKGGPASLFIAFSLYSLVLACINNSLAEMQTHMPVAGGFVRLAGYWVDDALGFMAGWNFFFFEALAIPFEITAMTFVFSFWSDRVLDPSPTAAICAGCIIIYGLLNFVAVKVYGESKFWLSSGKIILLFMLFAFTFITMVGGNPKGDAYGFRYWSNPGAFAEYLSQGDLGRFRGFLACLYTAAFTIVGPEYISMAAAETKHPSVYVKAAYETVYFRLCFFFVVGALAVSVVVPYDNATLRNLWFGTGTGSGSAAGSYVLAMSILGINVLPHIVNALILTSIFSAGNTYCFCASRVLHGLALEGRAPKILARTTKSGTPVYAFGVVLCFACLSFLQVSSGTATVLSCMTSLITGGGQINYIVMTITFLRYYKAHSVQGIDRKTRPYYGRFQPYTTWLAFVMQVFIVLNLGYNSFAPWDVGSFFASYTMQILMPVLFVAWKVYHKTRMVPVAEIDLVWERPLINAYEADEAEIPIGFWAEMGHLVGFRKDKQSSLEAPTPSNTQAPESRAATLGY